MNTFFATIILILIIFFGIKAYSWGFQVADEVTDEYGSLVGCIFLLFFILVMFLFGTLIGRI